VLRSTIQTNYDPYAGQDSAMNGQTDGQAAGGGQRLIDRHTQSAYGN